MEVGCFSGREVYQRGIKRRSRGIGPLLSLDSLDHAVLLRSDHPVLKWTDLRLLVLMRPGLGRR